MIENPGTGIAVIVAIGIASQWLGWRLRVPAILLLLAAGLVAGPVTGAVDPDHLFGELLFPVVSLSVAVILFEGGLSLKFRELRHAGAAVTGLVTVGVVVTWALATVFAWIVLDIDFQLSLLLGAMLTVTGPTVIGPMLRHIRPVGPGGLTLKWEGVLVDPIGALLAVLIFSAILSGESSTASGHTALTFLRSTGTGVSLGIIGAGVAVLVLHRYWAPDFLHEVTTLAMVLGVFVLSNELADESGLIAVTVMGVVIANQKFAVIKHIVEFKENLRVVLVSVLFIVLAARIELDQLQDFGWRAAAFAGLLIVVVRPLSVVASTFWAKLPRRDAAFVSLMAPRGIVAAAITADFSLRLAETGRPDAESLVPIMFTVIAVTVVVYSLAGPVAARFLGLAGGRADGVLILGAHETAQQFAEVLKGRGVKVSMIDTNRAAVTAARMRGVDARYVSVLSDDLLDQIDLAGVGSLLALSPNDELNSLACTHFAETLGRTSVFQLTPDQPATGIDYGYPGDRRGRILFSDGLTFSRLEKLRQSGGRFRATRVTDEFTYENYAAEYGDRATPMALVHPDGRVGVVSADAPPRPAPEDVIVAFVSGEAEDAEAAPVDVAPRSPGLIPSVR